MIQNPILTGFHPDPSICRVGDDYYVATSTFEWFPGVMIYHSKDLKNWRLVSRPLNRISQLNMTGNPDSGGVWAPCLSYADGMFWLIYSDIKIVEGAWKDGHNYLVTCNEIDGEWSEPVYLNSAGFDPSLFHSEDGKKYLLNMIWDYRPNKHSFNGIALQEYDHAQKKLVGKSEVIFTGTELGLTEAPHLYRIDGYYYLLTAEGGTKYEHAATLARSRDLTGPYELHPKNPILSSWGNPLHPMQKAGHGSMVQTQDGQWYLAHLMARPIHRLGKKITEERGYCPLGRETAIQKVEWENGWPIVTNGPLPSTEVEAPNLPEVKWEQSFTGKDLFEGKELLPCYQTLRIPYSDELGEMKDGTLRLFGRESLGSRFTQSHVARRWQDFSFDAETVISFHPDSFMQAAGLVCYYNTATWVSLQITWCEKKGRVLQLLSSDRGNVVVDGESISLPDEAEFVYLRTAVRKDTFTFTYSLDGQTYEKLAPAYSSYKLSDDYVNGGGFFTGAFVGMHCQDTSGNRSTATFTSFSYNPVYENHMQKKSMEKQGMV